MDDSTKTVAEMGKDIKEIKEILKMNAEPKKTKDIFPELQLFMDEFGIPAFKGVCTFSILFLLSRLRGSDSRAKRVFFGFLVIRTLVSIWY